MTYDPNIRPALLGTQAEARSLFEDLDTIGAGDSYMSALIYGPAGPQD